MSDYYFLCDAGTTLRRQVDRRWPKRDKASDGWIGDASHAAAVSDHNPCWTCTGKAHGVVRAIDLDANLNKDVPDAMTAFVKQLVELGRQNLDGHRVSYIIYNRRMWRSYDKVINGVTVKAWDPAPYTGTDDPHTSHAHISFTPAGDFDGDRFPLRIFDAPMRHRLSQLIRTLTEKIQDLKHDRAMARRKKHNL